MKTFSKVGALLLLIFAISSCSQDSTSTSYVIRPSVTSDWDSVGVSFVSNPFDSIGYAHNLAVDYVASKMNPGNWTADSVNECIYAFMHERWGSNVDSVRAKMAFADSMLHDQSPGTLSLVDSFQTLLNSADFVASTHRVDSLIKDSTLTKLDVLNGIRAEEAYVLAYPGFSVVQRDFLCEAYAIARYSYAYWHSTAATAFAPTVYGILPRGILGKGSSSKNGVVMSDVVGAIGGSLGGFLSGAVKGAIYGSELCPGEGTVGGAAGGAVLGSIKGAFGGAATSSATTAATGSSSTWTNLASSFFGGLFG